MRAQLGRIKVLGLRAVNSIPPCTVGHKPRIALTKVLFPAALAPKTMVVDPAARLNEISFTIGVAPPGGDRGLMSRDMPSNAGKTFCSSSTGNEVEKIIETSVLISRVNKAFPATHSLLNGLESLTQQKRCTNNQARRNFLSDRQNSTSCNSS